MNKLNVYLHYYYDPNRGMMDIEKDRLEEANYDIWREKYRSKIGLNLKIWFLKGIDDLKKCHDNNKKYNIYFKWVQMDNFIGTDKKVHELDIKFDNLEDQQLFDDMGFSNCVYPYDYKESRLYSLFKSKSWPDWIMEDLENGNCKIIFHSILEQFTSRGYDVLFRTLQYQLKEFNLKEKYITIIDWFTPMEEYVKFLDTEINFVYSNLELGFFIENEFSEIKKEYLPDKPNIERKRKKYFLSLNRNAKVFRAIVVYYLWKDNLLDNGYVSFWKKYWLHRYEDNEEYMRESITQFMIEVESGLEAANVSYSKGTFRHFVPDDVSSFLDFIFENDLIVDDLQDFQESIRPETNTQKMIDYPTPGHPQSSFGSDINNVYKNSYFNLTSCNHFGYVPGFSAGYCYYLDEKLFPSIIHFLPFILVGRCGILKEWKNLGFKTFHPFIDESYDEIENPFERMEKIFDEVNRLCGMSKEEIHNWYCEMKDILQYNYDFYFNEFLPLQVNNFYNEFLLEE